MRSVDVTGRARIRDAAIEVIGRVGYDSASIRVIAAAAGVSPALVIHHFGSKEGLRSACEEHLLALFAEEVDRLAEMKAADLGAILGRREDFTPYQGYLRRTLHDGGPFAERMVRHLISLTRTYLDRAVATGDVRPSEDEEGRAAALVAMSLGVQLIAGQVAPPGTPPEQQVTTAGDRLTLPMLDLLTHGLYVDASMLEAYRALRERS